MAAEDMAAAGHDGTLQEKMRSLSEEEKEEEKEEEDSPPIVPKETSAALLNLSDLSPCHFGISVQSFTPLSASNRKDKSRLAQIKARRRSNIGARGSPETNSLIRFMAQQRMKTPPSSRTPELDRSDSCTPHVSSALRQKMALFQTLMAVEENNACDLKPAQDGGGGGGGGCIKTRDYPSDGNSHGVGKENNPPVSPTPSKRRRLGPLEVCSEEIREAGAPILLSTLKEHKDGVFEARSPRRPPSPPPPVDPAAASPPQRSSPFYIPSLHPLLERRPTDVDGTPRTKRKQVRFGGPLSPELYDKTLPPNTPLQRGGTPARAPTPGGSLQLLRSLLKTPQGSTSKMSQSQLDLDSPAEFGASPTFSISHRRRSEIVFPPVEEIDSALTNETDYIWDTQPLNLDNAFHEESLAETVTAQDVSSELETAVCQMEDPDEPASCPQEDQHPEAGLEDPGLEDPAPGRSRNGRKKGGSKPKPAHKTPASPRSRKTKASSVLPQQPEQSEPLKRSTRSASQLASVKMTLSTAAARRWAKDVDRSLYGLRAYASKTPDLSPITERSSFISHSPATCQTASVNPAARNEDPQPDLGSASDTLTPGVIAVTDGIETTSEDLVASSECSDEEAAGRSKVGGRRTKGNVADTDLLSEEKENCEDKISINFNASPGDPSNSNAPLGALTSEYAASSDSGGKCDIAATSNCAPTGEESVSTEPTLKTARRGRRSRARITCVQEQRNHARERQTSREVENEQVGRQENLPASSVSHEERGASTQVLASWQADFNFEDVFKPVATRGQRSVRRSLRNRCNAAPSEVDGAGLAWLPRTSPDLRRESCRKSRRRRLSAGPPVEPSPQHAS